MREFIMTDIGWKLFSVALAVSIWLTVQTTRTERSSDWQPPADLKARPFEGLPVLVVSASADVREFKVNPKIVDVVVGGPSDALAALETKDLRVTVDLTNVELAADLRVRANVETDQASAALVTANLRARVNVMVPPGLTVLVVLPPEVDVVVPPKRDLNP